MSLGTTILPTSSTFKVLVGAGVKKMKYFKFDGFMFSPLYLGGLADDIKHGYLSVEKTNYKYNYYNAIKNTIYLNFTYASTVPQEAMIVHEATHTMFDFQGKPMTVATSESLAYIAQCMYVQLNRNCNPNDPDDRLGDWEEKDNGEWVETDKDGVYKKGWDIAKKIIAAGLTDEIYVVNQNDVDEMKKKVEQNPNYTSIASTITDYNGFR
jgi:hypothetical protein